MRSRNKWLTTIVVMLVPTISLMARVGPTPAALVTILIFGMVVFAVAFIIERVFGASAPPDEKGGTTNDLPILGQSTLPSTSTPPGAVAPGNPPPAASPSQPVSPTAITAQPLPMAPIPLTPAPAAKPTTASSNQPPPPDGKDPWRELIETVVFVVVLVLMLKTFLAEAFVIPTGSMATTLLGYHYKVNCAQCGYPNLINASKEAEAENGRREKVTSYFCEPCRFLNVLRPGDPQ